MDLSDLASKSILIYGFGREGYATYTFLRARFPAKAIAIADDSDFAELNLARDGSNTAKQDPAIEWLTGQDLRNPNLHFDLVFKAPGIPPTNPAIVNLVRNGAAITSHLSVFFDLCPRDRLVGVTGTKGKSTTTKLLYEMVHQSGLNVVIGGNIGTPPLPMLQAVQEGALCVLELSSYQLAPLTRSPHIAVLLNIVPEHLDYHVTFDAYIQSKENITSHQETFDYLIYNSDFPIPCEIASRSRARCVPFSVKKILSAGTYLESDQIVFRSGSEVTPLLALGEIPMRTELLGAFNIQNVMAAATAAHLMDCDASGIRTAVQEFKSLPHRLQNLGQYRGVTFIDNSIATVPEATLAALDALSGRVHTLLLGGFDRGLDFTSFGKELVLRKVPLLILFPETGRRIWEAVEKADGNEKPVPYFVTSMDEAVRIAFQHSPSGSVCLLSPASPSFGLFRNYEHRGEVFWKSVEQLGTGDLT